MRLPNGIDVHDAVTITIGGGLLIVAAVLRSVDTALAAAGLAGTMSIAHERHEK